MARQDILKYAQALHVAADVSKLTYRSQDLPEMSLKELITATPDSVREKSYGVRLLQRHFEAGSMDGFRRTYYKYKSYYNQARVYSISSKSSGGSGRKHRSIIRFYGPVDPNTPVWVWCDCEYFLYYLEVVLSELGSSVVENSNGEQPNVTNLMKIPYLCKHLYKAQKWALTQRGNPALEKMQALEKSEAAAQSPGERQAAAGFVSFKG